jgi:septal ring factor EnvC (AmiA/AmiB activator)
MKKWLVLLLIVNNLYAQEDREKFEKMIEETNQLITQMRENHTSNLSKLKLLNLQLTNRKKQLQAIRQEIIDLDNILSEGEILLNALQSDLSHLKEEYAKLLYTSSKLHSSDKLSYLFSSQSFNELWIRSTYFKQYTQIRRKQIELIEKVTAQIQEKNHSLSLSKQSKVDLLQKEQAITSELSALQVNQSKLVASLKLRENQLLNELSMYKNQLKEIDKLLEAQVEESLENVSGGKSSDGEMRLLPEAGQLSLSFQSNKGKLDWPVKQGVISGEFGKQPHPVLENIFTENKGIDIRTKENETIRTVFQGKVTAVSTVPGMNYLVLVQHGKYFSVYANLKSVKVKIGQNVELGEEIGTIATDPNGVSELQFQIWYGNQKLNPATWLKKTKNY